MSGLCQQIRLHSEAGQALPAVRRTGSAVTDLSSEGRREGRAWLQAPAVVLQRGLSKVVIDDLKTIIFRFEFNF